jgi:ASC-1-like (ASCH) protein
MLHKMKLQESPFERIKSGTKTVEFRLYDEKEAR